MLGAVLFFSLAGIAFFSIVLSGCIRSQSFSSDCDAATGGDFNKSLCYQQQAVALAVYNDVPNAGAQAVAICIDNAKVPDDDVKRSCVTSVASALKDPSLCDKMPTAKFLGILSTTPITGTDAQVAACKAGARPPTNACASAMVVLSVMLGAVFMGFAHGKTRAKRKIRN